MKSVYIKPETVKLWSLFIVLLFFAGFRWDVGIDWASYMNLGEHAPSNERLEPANLLVKTYLYVHGYQDGGYWLWIMAFLILFFFFYSFWKFAAAPVFSAVLFVCLGPFFDSLNGVRQYAAIAIFVYSWLFIIRKQFGRYLIALIIGSFFHRSILFMIPIYWLVTLKYNKTILWLLCILFIPLSFVSDSLLPRLMSFFPQYALYEDMSFAVGNNNTLSLLRLVFPVFLFLLCIKLYDSLSKNRENLILCNLSFISILITILFPTVQIAIRIGFYFQAAFLFLIPVLSQYMKGRSALAFKAICIGYGLAFLYFTQFSKPVAKIWPFRLDFRLADSDLLLLLLTTLGGTLLYIGCMQGRIQKHPRK